MAGKSNFEEGNLFLLWELEQEKPVKKTDLKAERKRRSKRDSRKKTAENQKPAAPFLEMEPERTAANKKAQKAEEVESLFQQPVKSVKSHSADKKAEERKNLPGLAASISKGASSPGEAAAAKAWKEKLWEFDLTKPSQFMKDTMKESMLAEGFGKREANKVFKGLFFKEKVCNTRSQALEYLMTIPNSYAVKYKIGIPPSPQMEKLEKRLREKEERLTAYKKEQAKKFKAEFLTCPHCKSRVNAHFIHPPLCPVCGEDLRSETAVKALSSLEEAVKDLKKRYEDTARRYNSKFTGGEKWIIRLVNPLYEDDSK